MGGWQIILHSLQNIVHNGIGCDRYVYTSLGPPATGSLAGTLVAHVTRGGK